MRTDDFLGLSKKRSQDLAEARNLIWWIIRIDDVDFNKYPEDLRTDRICIEIDNGKVTRAVVR